ncbi:hypothetical protein FW320_00085 [Azospirillum sp. Vi22]|uniref:hypothetical protein n=1 Tax=Azospirillum baldaniorum TaxID=1064539 RepID=UPI00157A640A|nr:hypothetical protein [Azospirillum baldaniorum]NUB04595.1 hypothetical protein [Azospirillum baldaniorum]
MARDRVDGVIGHQAQNLVGFDTLGVNDQGEAGQPPGFDWVSVERLVGEVGKVAGGASRAQALETLRDRVAGQFASVGRLDQGPRRCRRRGPDRQDDANDRGVADGLESRKRLDQGFELPPMAPHQIVGRHALIGRRECEAARLGKGVPVAETHHAGGGFLAL